MMNLGERVPQKVGFYVAGKWREGKHSHTLVNPTDPADVVAVAWKAETELVHEALEYAAAHAAAWPPENRRSDIAQMASRLHSKAAQMAALLSRESGRIFEETHFETRWLATQFDRVGQEARETGDGPKKGIAAVILPRYWPLAALGRVLPKLLAAGQPILLKSASSAPTLVSQAVKSLAPNCPQGFLSVLSGPVHAFGPALCESPLVTDLYVMGTEATAASFRSVRRGHRFYQDTGGVGAAIVTQDAVDDLPLLRNLCQASLESSGFAPYATRWIVGAGRLVPELIRRLRALLDDIRLGPSLSTQAALGGMPSPEATVIYERQLAQAATAGAQVWRGGIMPAGSSTDKTNLARPSLLLLRHPIPRHVPVPTGPALHVVEADDDGSAMELAMQLPGVRAVSWWGKEQADHSKLERMARSQFPRVLYVLTNRGAWHDLLEANATVWCDDTGQPGVNDPIFVS